MDPEMGEVEGTGRAGKADRLLCKKEHTPIEALRESPTEIEFSAPS